MLILGFVSHGQSDCPVMTFPATGTTNVPVNTAISWNAVSDAIGYYLLVGTTPGGRDIVDRVDVGNVTTYTHPTELPENTEIYVKVTVYFESTFDMTCPIRNFNTGDGGTDPPACTMIISPQNGDREVATTTELEWPAVSGASGYRMIFYQDATGTHVLDTMTYSENRTGEINLPANTTMHIAIMPFNEVGNALGCTVVSFTTVSECTHTINPVDDFFTCDRDGDNFEEFNIDLNILSNRLIGNQTGLTLTYHNPGGDLIDFSIGTQFALNQRRVMARATDVNGCFKETLFNLIVLPPPIIATVSDVSVCEAYVLPELPMGNAYFTKAFGKGTQLAAGDTISEVSRIYIYAKVGDCDNQSSFQVRIDPTACQEDPKEMPTIVFPKFFTPNNDGVNDTWYAGREANLSNGVVQIFDRYNKLLSQFDIESNLGWDGTFKGRPLPASDYWFRAVMQDGQRFNGHFTLKR